MNALLAGRAFVFSDYWMMLPLQLQPIADDAEHAVPVTLSLQGVPLGQHAGPPAVHI